MRVHLTGHGTRPERMEGYRSALDALAPRYAAESDPERAEIVFFAEPGSNKFRSWIKTLEADQLITRFPEKCLTYDFSDRPIPFLPGLFPCMLRERLDPLFAVAADFWWELGGELEDALLASNRPPRLLFSFRGFDSAKVRKRIFALDISGVEAEISQTHRWRDYGEATIDTDKRAFVEQMHDSAFVLCPRGASPANDRIYEAMYLGRVPVIISDQLALAEDVPWERFSMRIAERDVEQVPEVLLARRDEAEAMGRAARAAWERFMRPGPALMGRWLDAAVALKARREQEQADPAEIRRRWRSNRFLWDNDIHPVQSALARIRSKRSRQ